MSTIFARVFATAAIAALLGTPAEAGYVSFDPPTGHFIMPTTMNSSGAIAGYWYDGKVYHGFLREPDGTFATFDPPGSVETTPLGMNDKGYVVGTYEDIKNEFGFYHGFVRRPDGTIVTYDAPGGDGGDTAIWGINKKRTLAGTYADEEGVHHSFILKARGDFTSFDPPGAATSRASAISDKGTVTGYYSEVGQTGGFMRTSDGAFTTFNAGGDTYPKGVTSRNVISGEFSGGHVNGFVRQPDGSMATFTYPKFCCTYVQGMNNQGSIVGYFLDDKSRSHGYLRTAKGQFTLIQPDESLKTSSEASAINANGQIAGHYDDDIGGHGFLYTP